MNDEIQEVKFVCPDCGGNRLECVMDGIHSCVVASIDSDGDHEYGEYESSADVDRWQCVDCGFVIPDGTANLIDNVEVAEWCLENCPQD